jgi:hypothetical protein
MESQHCRRGTAGLEALIGLAVVGQMGLISVVERREPVHR